MNSHLSASRRRRLAAFGLMLAAGAAGGHLEAQQQRLVIPEGTVLTVRTHDVVSSETARLGDVVITTVTDSIRIDGHTVIPRGSRIEGTVSLARPATSRESGLVGVDFTRLVLPGGRAFPIQGKLTSTDPAERRQIEAQGDARVVFVGGRTGVGAAVGAIGGGAANDPVSGALGALGQLLSRGADVSVPANTPLAVQLEAPVTMTVSGPANLGSDRGTIYTSAEMVRSAQQALRARNYYRGAVDGRLTNETRRALFDFQIDSELYPTGNLDGETAAELGLRLPGAATGLTPVTSAALRRNAQALVASWRDLISVSADGRMDARRAYQPAELDLYFALSAFVDNAAVYDQMIRTSSNPQGLAAAGSALVGAARRVDAALQRVSAPSRVFSAWQTIQSDLRMLDARYPM